MGRRFTSGKRRLSDKPVQLMLAPMIDMFTNLLVFMLMNFQVSNVEVTPDPDLTLPSSRSDSIPRLATKVVVSKKTIIVEGKEACPVVDGGVDARYKDAMIIKPISALLKERRDMTEFIATKNTTVKFDGTILLQADKDMSYRLLNEIMYTAGKLGFLNFVLLAYQKPGAALGQ